MWQANDLVVRFKPIAKDVVKKILILIIIIIDWAWHSFSLSIGVISVIRHRLHSMTYLVNQTGVLKSIA